MKRFVIMIIILMLFWSWLTLTGAAYAAQVITLPDIISADTITADENQLYITGGPSVYIYSMKDFCLVKKFGSQGEGPGEFKISRLSEGKIYIHVLPDRLLINSQKRISYFSKKGEFIKETRVLSGSRFKTLGNHFVGRGNAMENNTAYRTINIHNANLEKIKELSRKEAGAVGKKINPVELMKPPLFYTCGNKIVFEGEAGVLQILDNTSEKIRSIPPLYEKVKFTGKDKEKYEQDFKAHPRFRSLYDVIKNQFEYPAYYPLIRHFTAADNEIYVLTYKEENGKSEFFVFSIAGELLKKVMLPVKEKDAFEPYPYTIKNRILYQLADNEETEKWELHVIPF